MPATITTVHRRAGDSDTYRVESATAPRRSEGGPSRWRRWLLPTVWLLAASALAALQLGPRASTTSWLGQVERHDHLLYATEAAPLAKFGVAVGDRVAAGQVLVWQSDSDVLPIREALLAEAATLNGLIAAEAAQAAVDDERWRLEQAATRARLQVDLAGIEITDARQRREQAAARAQLAVVESELARLAGVADRGLLSSDDSAALRIQAAGLGAAVPLGDAALALADNRRPALAAAVAALEPAPMATVLPGGGRAQLRLAEVRTRLAEIDAALAARQLVAPVDGVVTAIFTEQGALGTQAARGGAILNIQAETADRVLVYVPVTDQQGAPAVGQQLGVRSAYGVERRAVGEVIARSPGLVPLPADLLIGPQPLQAWQLVLTLESGHELQPGERVSVHRQSPASP